MTRQLARLVIKVEPAIADKLRVEALRAWRYEVRRVTVHPERADEEREEFVQRWIGEHVTAAMLTSIQLAAST